MNLEFTGSNMMLVLSVSEPKAVCVCVCVSECVRVRACACVRSFCSLIGGARAARAVEGQEGRCSAQGGADGPLVSTVVLYQTNTGPVNVNFGFCFY